MSKYGYIRVSSKDQNPSRQEDALLNYGIVKENIYTDYMSGKDFNRPRYRALMRKLKRGDVLVIKSIDRLGRNYTEIIEQWRIIYRTKKADIEVVDFPLLNTNQSKEGLTGEFISNLTLQILAYVAQTERDFIKQRQAEGIAVAKANGVKFGARKKPIPKGFNEACILSLTGKVTIREAAEMVGMSPTTFFRRLKEIKL